MTWIAKKLELNHAEKIMKRTMILIEHIKCNVIPLETEVLVGQLDQATTDLVQLICHVQYLENVLKAYTGERPSNISSEVDLDDFELFLKSMQNSIANIEVIR